MFHFPFTLNYRKQLVAPPRYAPRHKDVRQSGVNTPRILNLGTRRQLHAAAVCQGARTCW
jgi:hypothetical protein